MGYDKIGASLKTASFNGNIAVVLETVLAT